MPPLTAAPHGTMRPEEDPGWAGYGETILVVHGESPLEIDLARPVRDADRAGLVAQGLPGPFGLVTPCNPRGHAVGAAENAALLRDFLAELDAGATRYLRVDGCSRDRCHVEPGVALSWTCEAVVDLAVRWRQSAIYWYDGRAFWVIGALTRAAPWRLGAAS